MRCLKNTVLLSLFLLFSFVWAGSIRIFLDGKYSTSLVSYSESDTAFVSAEDLCHAISGEAQWDSTSEKRLLSLGEMSIQVIPGNPFVRCGDLVYQVFPEPVWDGQGIWVPLAPWVVLLSDVTGKAVSWTPDTAAAEAEPKAAPEGENDFVPLTEKRIPSSPSDKKRAISPVSNGKLEKIETIVLDPGHGGEDPGALGPKGLEEKKIVLEIAQKLKKILEKKGVRIILTRENDTFIKLGTRTKIANDSSADLFLSIHCNSIGSKKQKSTSGFKAYINKAAQSDDDRLVAMKENAAIRFETTDDKKKGLTETEGILLDILNTEFLRESEDWASMVVDEMETDVPQVTRQHTGVGQAGFYVLAGAFMPAVLMEVAYISHPNESQLLKSAKFQEAVAKALAQSILRFKEKYEGR